MSADDLKARLRMIHEWKVGREATDRIEQLEAALEQSQAEVAAAYERAAERTANDAKMYWENGMASASAALDNAAAAIRALATPEQTAALDAVRAEARAQGMREAENRMKAAIEASGKLGRIIGFLGEDEGLIVAFREACGPELIARFHAATKGAKA